MWQSAIADGGSSLQKLKTAVRGHLLVPLCTDKSLERRSSRIGTKYESEPPGSVFQKGQKHQGTRVVKCTSFLHSCCRQRLAVSPQDALYVAFS